MTENELRNKQSGRIINYIAMHGSITQIEALNELGVMRLASRMSDLKKLGYPVRKEMVEVSNRFGEKCRIAKYSIDREDILS